jgi:hypothetical protein
MLKARAMEDGTGMKEAVERYVRSDWSKFSGRSTQ